MQESLEASLARIHTADGRVVGAGFLVGDRQILTCAHVISQALGLADYASDPPQGVVSLDFPLLAPRTPCTAKIVQWCPLQPDGRGDIAGLELQGEPPAGAPVVRFASAEDLWEHPFRAFRAQHFVPIVVCSRSHGYVMQEARLRLPVAFEVRPPTPEQVDTYLTGVGKPLAAVRVALRSNAVLRDLVTTPLMLSVVMLAYRSKTVEDLPQLGSAEDQQRQVFEHYVTHMLEQPTREWRYTPSSTQKWLIWLAQQMKQRQLTEFYLERLQPAWLPTKRTQIVYKVLGVLLSGLVFRLVFVLPSVLVAVLVVGLLGALVVILMGSQIQPSEKLTWSWNSFLQGLGVGLVFGLLSGLVVGLRGGLLGGLSDTQVDEHARLRPNQGIQTSGWNALRSGLVIGLLVGLVYGALQPHLFGRRGKRERWARCCFDVTSDRIGNVQLLALSERS